MRTPVEERDPERNDPRLSDAQILVERVKLAHDVLALALHAAMPGQVRPRIQAAHRSLGGALQTLQGKGPGGTAL